MDSVAVLVRHSAVPEKFPGSKHIFGFISYTIFEKNSVFSAIGELEFSSMYLIHTFYKIRYRRLSYIQ